MVATHEKPASSAREERRLLELVPDRTVRRDALPEHTNYVDSGCDLHPSCLSCPLARCRYDEPGGVRRIVSEERDRLILHLRREADVPVNAIARQFGVSRRTVFRVLARAAS